MKQSMDILAIKNFVKVQKIAIPLSFSNPKSGEKSTHPFSYLLNPQFGLFFPSNEFKKIARHLCFSPAVEDLQNPKKLKP